MFAHRSFLILGSESAADIISLIKGGYEISRCNFAFQQGADAKGRVSTRVFAGTISIVLPQLPPQPIVEWAIRPRKYNDGVIVLVDAENIPLEKIFFKNAACIGFDMDFVQQDESYSTTSIVVQAEKIIVGNGVDFNSEWTV